MAFEAAAKMHAPYWNKNETLSNLKWLRGVGWINNQDETSWMNYQKQGVNMWKNAKLKMGELNIETKLYNDGVSWDLNLIECINASMAKVEGNGDGDDGYHQGWLKYQNEINIRPQTLVHGDFHPANMMIANAERMIMLDFEQVGMYIVYICIESLSRAKLYEYVYVLKHTHIYIYIYIFICSLLNSLYVLSSFCCYYRCRFWTTRPWTICDFTYDS